MLCSYAEHGETRLYELEMLPLRFNLKELCAAHKKAAVSKESSSNAFRLVKVVIHLFSTPQKNRHREVSGSILGRVYLAQSF